MPRMSWSCAFVVLLCISVRLTAAADPLATLRPGHPRLLLASETIPTALQQAKTDPLRAALHQELIRRAEAMLDAPPLVYRVDVPRLLLAQARLAIERIMTCGFAFQLTHDARFADCARANMRAIAAFPDWHPDHFLDVAELSLALSIGYDWLYHELPLAERTLFREALREKALRFAPLAYASGGPKDPRLWFATAEQNWNQVGNGGLLAAALALADEEPELARLVVEGARTSLQHAMGMYAPDGAYPEGPIYWGYGTNYNVLALAMLESSLGSDLGLSAAPGFNHTADYRLAVEGPTGLGFNYADGLPTLGAPPAFDWLALRFGNSTAVARCRQLLEATLKAKTPEKENDRFLALHALWFPVPEHTTAPAPLDQQFRGAAELALFRNAWADPNALFVGFKAGTNSVNHAHLDLGSFVLESDGVRWALDLGPDNYALPGYFGDRRWSYYRLGNVSHNTLTPGDRVQDPKASTHLTAFRSTPERAYAVADLTSAYPDVARQWLRGIALLDRSRVLVVDEWHDRTQPAPLHWRMVTSAAIKLSADGRVATLERAHHTLRIELLGAPSARFTIESTKPPTSAENANSGTAILAITLASTAPDQDNFLLPVLFTPVGEKWSRQLPLPEVVPPSQWP